MRRIRASDAWPFVRCFLPEIPASRISPLLPLLGPEEAYEAHLLRLSDQEFARLMPAPTYQRDETTGAIVTGNPLVDQWEREFAAAAAREGAERG